MSNKDDFSHTIENGTHYVTLGKVFISHDPSEEMVHIIVDNASHRAWKGFGKVYRNWEEAIAKYKSAAIKNALGTARVLIRAKAA